MTEKKRSDERDDERDEMTPPKTTRHVPIGESSPTAPEPLSFTLDPTSGPEQTAITITGSAFGETPGTLMLNEVPAPVVVWTPLAIQTLVPYGAKTGDLVVTTSDGRRGAAPFSVTTTPAA